MNLKEILRGYSFLGFLLSRKAWESLEFAKLSGSLHSKGPLSEIYLLRQVADRINEKNIATGISVPAVRAGELASVSILVDILRYLIEIYVHEEQPGSIERGLKWVGGQQGKDIVSQPPPSFVRLFPPVSVLRGQQLEPDYFRNSQETPSENDRLIGEMTLLYISNANPAFRPYLLLFGDSDLKTQSPYVAMIQNLEIYFASQPPLSHLGLTLFQCLYAPITASPDSLKDQLEYIRRHWGHFLPLDLLERLLLAVDILEEERAMRGLGAGRIEALRFDRDFFGYDLAYAEPAAFSRDADWMSNVVLMAKSVYVWLFQLSQKYQRDIRLLSDIPDEELDLLARWGFTGLWLIGLWERSDASRKIKQAMGNPEAASSAYSLYDYVIARDLGGEDAFQQLKERAARRGLRLASDMVPNHMGIYSKWTIEHPQWFLQSDHPPFPVYQYNGMDLSEDPRVCLQIEDGYWQQRDAAVVFKRIDKWTGDTRYIYHGNDGTSMPWNDTAQLNFLMPEVREAVIQTILHVARKFSIIRFDAAMTLAKRHYQRLWFPQPGEGGAIPSRAEHGMTRAQFDTLMPKEFWREVVDRVAQEVPETLLLAEAFWLMEGYFVRTLGMHRVYNSAFMNMLKMEDNAKYRTTLKNVLEFSPEVIKRFVNFMNNPDERSAVDQFGRDDKYFGVAVMMVTMPGLPMFGHGQIEGFSEKYGMEYRRSYWDEKIDWGMVHRHENQIFPLMRRRHLFSGAANFAFFDFVTPDGWVDENVFAYTNRAGGERAVILYNNAYNTTRGTIHTSTAINIGDGDKSVLVRRSLGEALALNSSSDCFYAFRDYQSGLEYIRYARNLIEQGLFAELHAYQYHAFLDFREIHDNDGSWRRLEQKLDGAGVPNIDDAYREMILEPVLTPFRRLVDYNRLKNLSETYPDERKNIISNASDFYSSAARFAGLTVGIAPIIQRFMSHLDLLRIAPGRIESKSKRKIKPLKVDSEKLPASHILSHVIFSWLALSHMGQLWPEKDKSEKIELTLKFISDWLLLKQVRDSFESLLENPDQAYWDSQLVYILLSHSDSFIFAEKGKLSDAMRQLLIDTVVREYLQVHSFDNTLWLNKERLVRLCDSLAVTSWLHSTGVDSTLASNFTKFHDYFNEIKECGERAQYNIDKLLALLSKNDH
ncbi:conserved hypothetical protein [Candidatus Zixiibacteriota bacterium]|nr:conserved hypothetical protein [candidate division Zixibacteria bacterium]